MKKLFLLGLAGLFSMVSVLETQACHHRRCGGRHHHRRGGGCCYAQPVYNGGCHTNGGMSGGYVDPNAAGGAAVEGAGVGAGVGAEAGANVGGTGAAAGANVRGRLP
jgi:hypothetical protein